MEENQLKENSLENEYLSTKVERCSLSDFIEVELSIKIFGRIIINWHFPPKKV